MTGRILKKLKSFGEDLFHAESEGGLYVQDDNKLLDFEQFGTKSAMGMMASSILLMGLFVNGKRRRRDAESRPDQHPPWDMLETHFFFDILNDVDKDDCLALSLCQISSMKRSQLTNEQRSFLHAFSLEPKLPPSLDTMPKGKAKFEYAAYIGQKINSINQYNGKSNTESNNSPRVNVPRRQEPRLTSCAASFPKCRVDPADILNMMNRSTESACHGYFRSKDIAPEM